MQFVEMLQTFCKPCSHFVGVGVTPPPTIDVAAFSYPHMTLVLRGPF